MARTRRNDLPKYLEFNRRTGSYYYKNPSMEKYANLGKSATSAVQLAKAQNAKYRIQQEQSATRLEATIDFGGPLFADALDSFVGKYIDDYRLKSSTAALLRQRQERLSKHLRGLQVATIDTQILREAISEDSQYEQSKLKTLLTRFFRYSKSNGTFPSHLPNPVNDLFIDPIPRKQ